MSHRDVLFVCIVVFVDSIDEVGNSNGTQCVYTFLDQNFSPQDLTLFQQLFHLPQQTVYGSIGGHNSSTQCMVNPSSCKEANLDIQYIMAVGQNVRTYNYFQNSSNFLIDWFMQLTNEVDPPMVISISYGAIESTVSKSYMASFDISVKSLAVMGVTILSGSGDDGASGIAAMKGLDHCSYAPIWPASSPYVLAVGATQGPESGSQEVTCASNTGGTITSGGGFSNLYEQPSWQADAVNGYFDAATSAGVAPVSGYNISGRGYPDISLMGHAYEVIIGLLTT